MWANIGGLSGIINQLVDWLENAATDTLIDPSQGWEPIRRDHHLPCTIIYDIEEISRKVQTGKSGSISTMCGYIEHEISSDAKWITAFLFEQDDVELSPAKLDQILQFQTSDSAKIRRRFAPAFILWGASETKNYRPDTVYDLDSLLESAEWYGCKPEIERQINTIKALCNQPTFLDYYEKISLRVFIILCAMRPQTLIGGDSKLEFIPYLANLEFTRKISPLSNADQFILVPNSTIKACWHQHRVNRKLLRRLSGGSQEILDQPIIQIGCGSLGSKITMHLARAGYGPFTLIDQSSFSPHNTARHALVQNSIDPIDGLKVMALARELGRAGQGKETTPLPQNVIELVGNGWKFPENTYLVIDSTGSITVREYLTSLGRRLPGKLMHTVVLGNGAIGLIATENAERNPNVSDLIAYFWNYVIENKELQKVLSLSGISRQPIGQGCDSYTMVMPDSKISLFAASMAERARQILQGESIPKGEILIGHCDNSGLGVQWEKLIVSKCISIKAVNHPKWEIRIFEELANQIADEAKKWGEKETGGVLLGRISLLRHSITITRIIEAPPDSERSEGLFILGTQGLKQRLRILHKQSCEGLMYVGTWHSHPQGGKASALDSATLTTLVKLRLGFPAVFIVWTPDAGLQAIMGEGDKVIY